MLLWIGGVLILFGGAAVVIRTAENRGRNPVFWGVVAILTAAAAGWAAWEHLSTRIASGDAGLVSAAMVLLAPIAAHTLLGAVVLKLPAPAGRTRASSWPMTRMDADQGRCILRLTDTGVAIVSSASAIEVAYGVLTSVRADGECLRVHWLDGGGEQSVLLMPIDGPRIREGRVRLLEAIARRVRARMTR